MISRLAGALALLCISPMAAAQGIEGGSAGLDFIHNGDRGQSETAFGGSLDMGLGGVGLQGDLTKRVISNAPGSLALGAHVFTGVGQTGAVGAFGTYENRGNDRHDMTWGIEGKLASASPGGFEGQAYLMRVHRNQGRSNFNAFGLTGSVGIGAASALNAGYLTTSDGADLRRLSVGYDYRLTPAATIGAEAARLQTGTTNDLTLGLSFGYAFGKGAMFGRRDLPHLAPGY